MKKVVFIGLGVMGGPMARNLLSRGFDVVGADVDTGARELFTQSGGFGVTPEQIDFAGIAAVVMMLPEGDHVRGVMENFVLPNSDPGTILVDCSTIDVDTTRELADRANDKGLSLIDAPVSGGPPAAGEGTLSLMVGGEAEAVARATPLLNEMGGKITHFGPSGAGQSAKACHNMICGITAMAVCEGYALADSLGLDMAQFHSLCMNAAARSWTLENRCPIPGLEPAAPASNDYAPGFAARLMAKDLRLAQAAAATSGQSTPFGAEAARAFSAFAEATGGNEDFSAFYKSLRNQ